MVYKKQQPSSSLFHKVSNPVQTVYLLHIWHPHFQWHPPILPPCTLAVENSVTCVDPSPPDLQKGYERQLTRGWFISFQTKRSPLLQEELNGISAEKAVSVPEAGSAVASIDSDTDPNDSNEDSHGGDLLVPTPPGTNGKAPTAFGSQEQESDTEQSGQQERAFQTVDLQPDQ